MSAQSRDRIPDYLVLRMRHFGGKKRHDRLVQAIGQVISARVGRERASSLDASTAAVAGLAVSERLLLPEAHETKIRCLTGARGKVEEGTRRRAGSPNTTAELGRRQSECLGVVVWGIGTSACQRPLPTRPAAVYQLDTCSV
jgi:hypothetical protein